MTRKRKQDRTAPIHDREQEREADWRWGNTEAYAQSRKRASAYTDADWEAQRAEQDALNALTARLMREGRSPDSVEAMAAAELHRLAISKWFYDCPAQMHAMLADMYVHDDRFRANYEAIAPGLAAFHSASVKANALAQGAREGVDDALAMLKAGMGLGTADHDAMGTADDGHESQTQNKRENKREKKREKKR